MIFVVMAFQVLGLLSAVHAVMSVRTPQGAIAWAVSLVALPYVAVPAYWVFGRNKFQGYVLTRQQELQTIDALVRQARDSAESKAPDDPGRRGVLLGAERLARVPVTAYNSAELLVDGEATFASIFAGIESAQEYVLVQFYIVRDDDLGRQLQRRLIDKANSGVRVYFIFDEFGSLGLPESYLRELRASGARIVPFHSRKGSGNRFQLNFRNHRKTVVVDGRTAWIGGHNVGDEYVSGHGSLGRWRDTHMRLDGPAVIGAQLAFVEDWRWATDDLLAGLNWSAPNAPGGVARALVIASGPADRMETASLMFTMAINAASRRVWIASPYFVPDDAIVQALQLAGLRGVDVRILIPEKSDNILVTLAAYSYFSEVKAGGPKFYRYQDGFLHEKVMLIDENVAMVGTANFDNRSFRLNFEISSVVIDAEFASRVEDMFEADFSNSRQMEPNEFDEKPWWFRVAVRAARLTAPVL